MDEHSNDQYERQLYSVFQSCLAKGQSELQEDDWHILCHKLHLTEHSDELRSCIQRHKLDKSSISFTEFRSALLTLLDKSKELIAPTDGEINVEARTVLNQCDLDSRKSEGTMGLNEFLVIFQKKKDLQEQISLGCNDELTQDLLKLETNNRNHSPSEMWKVGGISTVLSIPTLDSTDISLGDLATSLCDELKSINESLDHSTIRSHISAVRGILLFYQEEFHKLNVTIENLNCEKEKLRTDILEANERANTLAQQIDDQHVQADEIEQTIRKQVEQRYLETIHELSNELNTERDISSTSLKTKHEQLQSLQKDIGDIRNKYASAMIDNQNLQSENETLQTQVKMLKQSNNELLSQVKVLAAEHDEAQNIETKQQQEVIFLIDRIKQLQSETVLLRDQNDELTMELETLRLRDCHNIRQSDNPTDSSLTRDSGKDEIDDKDVYSMDEEPDFDILMHSTMISSTDNELEDVQGKRKVNSRKLKEFIAKQLKNILSSKCSSENCTLRNEISTVISRLQANAEMPSSKEPEFVKSIASELESECGVRTSESLRDFVVSKSKNVTLTKRSSQTSSTNDISSDSEDNLSSQDSKSTTQSKTPSLRDYPPRKEENSTEFSRTFREKEATNHNPKTSTESIARHRSLSFRTESIDDITETHLRMQELEAAHAVERKQLAEHCQMLEKSLELLKNEYEDSELYWTAKLEEERQLFEQEQKISDEKFSDLIAKMAEYEELITSDESKNGRLSPIEEKFNLEQQYLDLEDEFERLKAQTEEEIFQKEKLIKELSEKLKSTEKPAMADMSVQVTDDDQSVHSSELNYVPTSSFNVWSSSESTSKLSHCTDNIRKLPDEFKLDRILEGSGLPSDFLTHVRPEPEKVPLLRKKRNITTNKSVSLMKEEQKHDVEYNLLQDALRLQNMESMSCNCMQNNTQQICCIDVNVLQNLNLRLEAHEREKHQFRECFRQYQCRIEHLLHHILTQHRVEMADLECLLRSTQQKLQLQYKTNIDQAEKLAQADVLVKDLYMENTCLASNMKRLEQHCQILSDFGTESTSI